MENRFKLLLKSLYYIKIEQTFYYLYYPFRNSLRKFVNFKYPFNLYRKGLPLKFDELIPVKESYHANTFSFLNQSVTFTEKIDWEYSDKGKLWTNHLNYFEYLMQDSMSKERGTALIYLLIDHLQSSRGAGSFQAYTLSLRGINWIKFISKHNITRKTLDRYLYCQYRILMDNLAYDRMGNHLLENGFSMLFGAYYFKGFELFNEAKIILTKELWEQVLPDGGHFQLSPMYHQIMLHRVLDCYNLMKNNKVFHDAKLQDLLKTTAQKMLAWLKEMTYENGAIPCLNDSTFDIAPSSFELFKYAERLGVKPIELPLKQSGYRKFHIGEMEGIIDIGHVGPDYQTTHGHSDTFNFELWYDKKPFIVDTGISTYSSNNIRLKERQTFSHNTVRFKHFEQTEVWGSFWVGRRAKTTVLVDEKNHVVATHDGYKKQGVIHQREFKISELEVNIFDSLISEEDELGKSSSFIHFHPFCPLPELEDNKVVVGNWTLTFEGQIDIVILDYNYALGFNKTLPAKMLQVSFERELFVKIQKQPK